MHVFVMMPYAPPFDEVFNKAIGPAIKRTGLSPLVVKHKPFVGSVPDEIKESTKNAELCVADVTGGNGNVMAEIGYAEAVGKPVILIAQGTPDAVPFDIRHNRVLIYASNEKGFKRLRQDIAQTIAFVRKDRESDLQMMRQLVLPNSIKGTPSSVVVAVNPLSYRAAYRQSTGWKARRAVTFSDYVGIRGLMRVFGELRMQVLPELVNPDDFDDAVLKQKMHLYLIGSPKANRWTGLEMERFFEDRQTKWDFRPDPESRNIWNPKVIIRQNGEKYVPIGWKGTDPLKQDFGIVLRGENPRDSSRMITVLAGRSSVGTEAAALAVTDPNCIRKLMRGLVHEQVDPEDHRQAFLAIVSVECEGEEAEFATLTNTFNVWNVFRC